MEHLIELLQAWEGAMHSAGYDYLSDPNNVYMQMPTNTFLALMSLSEETTNTLNQLLDREEV